jgi:Uri superfamily endonuclease
MVAGLIESIPREAGAYLLWLHLGQAQALAVGRLGSFSFPAGDYVYLGSAQGPGGLRGRLGRHLRGGGQRHWHIDYLRSAAELIGYGYSLSAAQPAALECGWSQKLAALPEAGVPVPGFGASDCRSGCEAHLVHFSEGFDHLAVDISLSLWGPEMNP